MNDRELRVSQRELHRMHVVRRTMGRPGECREKQAGHRRVERYYAHGEQSRLGGVARRLGLPGIVHHLQAVFEISLAARDRHNVATAIRKRLSARGFDEREIRPQ
jgi:hypothetical protein